MASSIPVAVNNLLTILEAALPSTIQVQFGPLPTTLQPKCLHVTEVIGDQEPAESSPGYRREETYSIVCELTAYESDQDFLKTMTQCFDMFKTIETTIGNNPWLSTTGQNDSTAAVRFAEVGDMTFTPQVTPRGQSNGSLQFHVRCSERITSLT